jgi:hypothetical protein
MKRARKAAKKGGQEKRPRKATKKKAAETGRLSIISRK